MLSYEPLWETMKKQQVSTYTLIHQHGINPRTVHNLKHNQSITLYTLEKLCSILHCTPNDIVHFINEPEV
ncbi:MAG: helix-turn-helix transcriptional regulator [Clostridia bacterium]|nr:helix-turn-helix transcriptional regulator [Clostridia bacterium]